MNIVIKDNTSQNAPIKFSDLKNGDIFQWRRKNQGWSDGVYLMLDNTISKNGQAFDLTFGGFTWFAPNESGVSYRIFNSMELSEVREFKS